jgi:sugar phosphate isomerase/epimerase
VSSSLGVLQLLDGLPSELFLVIWDAAHDALAGDDPKVSLALVADRLGFVNLKNATYVATEPAEDLGGAWKPWFVQGDEGLSNWSAIFRQLRAQAYSGPICLSGAVLRSVRSRRRSAAGRSRGGPEGGRSGGLGRWSGPRVSMRNCVTSVRSDPSVL